MKPAILSLPKICDPRGNLTFVQEGDQAPFPIARVYWTYDVPAGEERGGHSHHRAEELIIASSGSFKVHLTNGREWKTYQLNRPFQGLYVPPGYWRTLDDFASGSVCLVLTSLPYAEADYVREYEEFKRISATKELPL